MPIYAIEPAPKEQHTNFDLLTSTRIMTGSQGFHDLVPDASPISVVRRSEQSHSRPNIEQSYRMTELGLLSAALIAVACSSRHGSREPCNLAAPRVGRQCEYRGRCAFY